MALVLKDRVKETSVTTGTGAIALDGATGAYQTFSTIGNGNQTYYAIAGQTTTEWEVGIGTYTSSTDTLSRDTILASSNSGSIVTFSAGTKDVFITYPSEKAIYEEPNGETLINAGPITVIGAGVTSIPSLPAELGKFIGDVNSFAQIYTLNQNDGSTASADFVAYNDLTTDGYTYFTDMGISSSNYTSIDYPIFTPNSGYVFHQGGDFFIGNQTTNKDIKFFSGGVDVTDLVATFSGTDRSASFEADVSVGGAIDVTGAATFGSTVLLDADPTLALQAATKQYVDTAVSTGLHLHQPVLVATTGNLTATYNNGTAGVGATLTNSGTQVALAIDGINMTTTNRVLVWQQSAPAQNGIYDVTTVGSGSTNWVLTRSSDANTYVPQSDMGLGGGDYFFVQSGTLGAGDSYVCTNTGVIVFGTTPITFAQFSGAITYVGGTNIDVTGQTISLTGTVAATNGGTGTSTVTTGDLLYSSATNTWSKLPLGTAYKSLVVNSGGTQLEWNAVALNQSTAVSGALGPLNGGTGQSAYTLGDIIYSSATDTLAKLAGNTSTTKQYLSQTGTGSASAAPSWATISAADIGAGTLPAVRGGTGQSSYSIGDILYANTTTSLARLADVATGNALISGGLNVAPSWGKIALASAVSGTLPIANGGTNSTATPTAGGVAYGTGTAYAVNTAGTSGQYLTSGGAGAPTWTTLPTNVASISFGTTGLTPSTATTGAVTVAGTLALANGGTGATTRQDAMDALAGAVTSGQYLRGNGTDVVMSAIVAGDVPTLNQNTTGTAGNVTGIVAVLNGGTGSSTNSGARTNLGATTVGSNFFTLTNPTAITFPRINADNTVSALDAATFRTAIGAGTSSTTGTVTSVAFSTGTTGLSVSGSPITASGTITLAGTLAVANGGTAATTAQGAMNTFAGAVTSGQYLRGNGTNVVMSAIQAADVPTLNQNTTGSSGSCTGNAATATTLIGDQSNWASYRSSAVANMISWKNYGNGHIIFDASASTSPTGSAVNNTNAQVAWTGTYPTLMGWNGANTYGVRVDSARVSDSTSGNAATATTASALSSATWQRITGNAIDYGSYGSIGISGTTNAYAGISFSGVSGTLMMSASASGFYYNNSTWRVYWDGSGNQINIGSVSAYASDERLKFNVANIPNALDKVKAINGVTYDWDLEECNKWDFYPPKSDVGVIAQQIEKVCPEAVAFAPFDRDPLDEGKSKSGKEYLTVKYEKLVPLLIEAIKELKAEVDELKKAK